MIDRRYNHANQPSALIYTLFFLLCINSVVLGIEDVNDNGEYTENTSENDHTEYDSNPDVECGIWMAPSTIVGAGLGMFAGREFKDQEEILPTGDSLVPIIDYRRHAEANSMEGQKFLWDEYTWSADALMALDEGHFDVNIASPGLGSAANSFLPIYNVDEWFALKDTTGLHRSRDPGVGGFSAYHNRKSTARFPIYEGDELFVSCTFPLYEICINAIIFTVNLTFSSVGTLL
jgi:hypothetical protein